MDEITLYDDANKAETVVVNSEEHKDLMKRGWTSWKKPSPKKTTKKKS